MWKDGFVGHVNWRSRGMLALFSAKCLGVKKVLKQNRNFDTKLDNLGRQSIYHWKLLMQKLKEQEGEGEKIQRQIRRLLPYMKIENKART